jgi:prepilin signal peptidase PulO-like enzyme (type II secretory pathway)
MWALISILLMGAASAYAWWRMVRREPMMLPPTWLRVVIAALAAFGLSTVIRTAYLGGQIVHESPRLATPPAGVVPSPSKH